MVTGLRRKSSCCGGPPAAGQSAMPCELMCKACWSAPPPRSPGCWQLRSAHLAEQGQHEQRHPWRPFHSHETCAALFVRVWRHLWRKTHPKGEMLPTTLSPSLPSPPGLLRKLSTGAPRNSGPLHQHTQNEGGLGVVPVLPSSQARFLQRQAF